MGREMPDSYLKVTLVNSSEGKLEKNLDYQKFFSLPPHRKNATSLTIAPRSINDTAKRGSQAGQLGYCRTLYRHPLRP